MLSENEMLTLLIGMAAVGGAFLGTFIAAILSRAQVISALRQEWINSLRHVFSSFLTKSEVFIDVPNKASEEAYRAKVEVLEVVHQAKLYLNENERQSGNLLKMMEELPCKYSKEKNASIKYKEEKPKISTMMQDVLKQEWNRVRDGEILWSLNNLFHETCLPGWVYISRITLFWLVIIGMGLFVIWGVIYI